MDLPDFNELANTAVANPATSAEELSNIAMSRPDLRARIVVHPACSQQLRAWLLEHDEPARKAWEESRRHEQARPSVPPPPPGKKKSGLGWFALAVGLILVAYLGVRAVQSEETADAQDPEVVWTSGSGTAQGERVSPAPDSAISAELVQSPSLNISCEISSTSASCSILDRDYAAAGLSDCPDRLFSIVVEQETSLACGQEFLGSVGDPVTTLDYGMTVANDTVACESAVTGMTCWNQWTGHGFTISRESNVTF